jgi:hypothetical protein
MPLQATSGAASYDAFGGGAAAVPNYIEEVFSTYLYTGNGSTQNIVNGINLSDAFGKGGLTWIKSRSAATNNFLFDTDRGALNEINSNTTDAQASLANSLTSFNTDGFSLGSATGINVSAATYASWTFRRQPKFFDIVYYTGTGSNRTIAHNLGSVPGCIIIKSTDTVTNWAVYHRSLANTEYLVLNSTAAKATGATWWNSTTPTSSVFSVGTNSTVNASGSAYIAYVFAHDAGGFGLTGTDNVISCGSFSKNGTSQDISLGYEPQWILIKRTAGARDWFLVDNMRGWTNDPAASNCQTLNPNLSNAEDNFRLVIPTATGFNIPASSALNNDAHIYIAIRRGPMKVPTSGTSVFAPNAYSGTGTDTTITSTGFAPDLFFSKARTFDSPFLNVMVDRLRGASQFLVPTNTIAETLGTNVVLSLNMNGVTLGSSSNANNGTVTYAQWNFKRAPSFFDEVCYTGTGSATTQTHNLGVAPELMIVKRRTVSTGDWYVYTTSVGNTSTMYLNLTNAPDASSSYWNNTTPTSSVFSIGTNVGVNASGSAYVAYLFATCAGVSKVGSYTGNGSTQTIDCGFGAGGARFVLIKRTDSTGGWYVYDTARGMTVLTDPYLLVNSTAVEVATLGSVTTVSTGFAVNASILAAINTNTASYIFLAIA